nr:glycosyltransferase family 2 protein [Granulicella aggregans]
MTVSIERFSLLSIRRTERPLRDYEVSVTDYPLVSIVTPTRHRESYLPQAYACVISQTWPNYEWLVCDDSPRASAFMTSLSDDRVRYFHLDKPHTVGAKRNVLNSYARGAFIVHFDDDDLYAPCYLAGSVEDLQKHNADLRKLEAFFIHDARISQSFFWDQSEVPDTQFICKAGVPFGTRKVDAVVLQKSLRHRLGYGFSYSYKQSLWARFPFPDVDFAEDLYFMATVVKASRPVVFCHDEVGACIHLIHASNLSGCFPQYMIPPFLMKRLFPSFEWLFTIHPSSPIIDKREQSDTSPVLS